jgi:hypothetical protein
MNSISMLPTYSVHLTLFDRFTCLKPKNYVTNAVAKESLTFPAFHHSVFLSCLVLVPHCLLLWYQMYMK